MKKQETKNDLLSLFDKRNRTFEWVGDGNFAKPEKMMLIAHQVNRRFCLFNDA